MRIVCLFFFFFLNYKQHKNGTYFLLAVYFIYLAFLQISQQFDH